MPLAVELFCGKFGWSQGWLARGGHAIGFDIEHLPHHCDVPVGAELVLQDVLTLHGSQFRNADLIVASPPCQAFSWRAQPWKLAKAKGPDEVGLPKPAWWDKPQTSNKPEIIAMDLEERAEWEAWKKLYPREPPSTALFDSCFRIQREAIEATAYDCPACFGGGKRGGDIGPIHCARCAGRGYLTRHIPLIVENVRGAQPWVGRSAWNFGSFHLWGDVPALMPITRTRKCAVDLNWNRKDGKPSLGFNTSTDALVHGRDVPMGDGLKVPGMNFHDHEKTGKPGRSFQSAAVEGSKTAMATDPESGGSWFGQYQPGKGSGRNLSSKSPARKAASAQIAMIPPALSEWIAECFWPVERGR